MALSCEYSQRIRVVPDATVLGYARSVDEAKVVPKATVCVVVARRRNSNIPPSNAVPVGFWKVVVWFIVVVAISVLFKFTVIEDDEVYPDTRCTVPAKNFVVVATSSP